MLEWILAALGLLITACFFLLDGFNAYNLIQFFRGKKTPVEHLIERQERLKSAQDHKN
ncbi:MAG: hypothetical protein K2W88_14595 [Pararheinheimera sp.]|nr:hypothetical protein [Rheinheimera sp.]